MSDPEIEATLRILVLAGSETTATALSGIIGNLLGNSKAMKELTAEIRSSFRHTHLRSGRSESVSSHILAP